MVNMIIGLAVLTVIVDCGASVPEVNSDGGDAIISAEVDVLLQTRRGNQNRRRQIGLRTMNQRLVEAIQEVRGVDINGFEMEMEAETSEIRSLVEEARLTTAQLYQCSQQLQIRGEGGRCVDRVPRCNEFVIDGENAINGSILDVEYTPAELAQELLPGTLAYFICGDGFQLYLDDRIPAVCVPHNGWNRSVPTICQSCAEVDPNCRECANDICTSCRPGFALRQLDNSSTSCEPPPGYSQDNAAIDCDELLTFNQDTGSYWLKGTGYDNESVRVFCDQSTLGGGWTMLTQLREPLPEGRTGLDTQYTTNADSMWIKGCGTPDSVGCNRQGPDELGWDMQIAQGALFADSTLCANEGGTCSCSGVVFYGDPNAPENAWVSRSVSLSVSCSNTIFGDPAVGVRKSCRCAVARSSGLSEPMFRSVDWEAFLIPGEAYQLRQTISVGTSTSGGSHLDVAYTFTYPGYVLQDDADTDATENLTWALTGLEIIRDTTNVEWDESSNEGLYFYPPWSQDKSGTVINGCDGFSRDTRWTGCFRTHYGSAGIVSGGGAPDPPGSAFFPHQPGNEMTCGIFGPTQGGLTQIGTWCHGNNVQGTYWLRKASTRA